MSYLFEVATKLRAELDRTTAREREILKFAQDGDMEKLNERIKEIRRIRLLIAHIVSDNRDLILATLEEAGARDESAGATSEDAAAGVPTESAGNPDEAPKE